MCQDIINEIEKQISERGKIITSYKLLYERLIRISEAYEASLRKIPVLIDTAVIANSKQNESGGTSYGGVSFEASYIAKKEVDSQIDKSCKFNIESELVAVKLNNLTNELNSKDREFMTLLQNSCETRGRQKGLP